MQPDEPIYDCLNLQLKGYDFALLESCQKEIHRYAEIMGVEVEEWSVNTTSQSCYTKLYSRYTCIYTNKGINS